MDCKHGLNSDWCALCTGNLEYAAPSAPPPAAVCCIPKCQQKATANVGPAPVCVRHQLQLEKALIRHHEPFWKIMKDAERDWQRTVRRQAAFDSRVDWVYFVQIDDVIKIGHSVNVANRVRSFASYGHDVRILALEAGDRAKEQRLHRRFAADQATVGLSRELFNPSPELMDYIRHGRTCASCTRRARASRVFCPDHDNMSHPDERWIGHVVTHAETEAS